ncbi:low affinity iron permease family protein [Occallatibacter savannae]|uniref:low affinity iron permease family protein n=1 Tax=Occallatibacter savannae TaxID=1002691 RepID=UPI000D698DF5|nr:low affinity iron permease family protein [Occallatibacter savannae]
MSSTLQPARAHRRSRARSIIAEAAAEQTSHSTFARFSNRASILLGSKWAFIGAIAVVLVWGATGPIFHYSDTWQLVINTGTTIVTFLMVFLIQNTQNRDAQAMNLKLNELILSIGAASNRMMAIESLSDEELSVLHDRYEKIRAECVKRGKDDRQKQ